MVKFAVPPDILDYPTSTDMVVREGSNVTLRCAATGSPEPMILWRRENGENISLQDGQIGMYHLMLCYSTELNTSLENIEAIKGNDKYVFHLLNVL